MQYVGGTVEERDLFFRKSLNQFYPFLEFPFEIIGIAESPGKIQLPSGSDCFLVSRRLIHIGFDAISLPELTKIRPIA